MPTPRLDCYPACEAAVNKALHRGDARYLASKYEVTLEVADKIVRVNGDMRNNVNVYTYTTLGAGQFCEGRFIVVMVKLRPGYANARFDENALDNTLKNALNQAAA